MAMNIETGQEVLVTENNHNTTGNTTSASSKISPASKWWLTSISCIFNTIGSITGPLLLRLYYLHGGKRIWISSWLQVVGFPILLLPLTVLYFLEFNSAVKSLASPKLLMFSAPIGLVSCLNGFMYSYGSLYLTVSTSQLLLSTQLAFTAFFALFIVKQKFTSYSINAVVLITLGSIMLGLRKNENQPNSVTNGQYFLGFFLTLGAAGLCGFVLTCSEFAYTKTSEAITYSKMLQFMFIVNFFATMLSTVAMLINKDFMAMTREASEFRFGQIKYYILLGSSAVVWQMAQLGMFGLLFCTSSVFVGVCSTALLPLTEFLGTFVFHEKFTGEKGVALALCLWGMTSYFYGSYKKNKKQKQKPQAVQV